MLKYTLDESKSPRVLTLTSDKANTITGNWNQDSVQITLLPTLSDASWKLISNDGKTAVFNG